MEGLVEARGLWKRLGGRWVLRDIALSLRRGEILFITGSNGSGKTTLLKILAGLVRPSRGSVVYLCRGGKRCIGYSGHNPMLYDVMTARENLEYYATLYGIDPASIEGNPAWEGLKLDRVARRRVSELSYGWRKRVDIMRAILHDPKIILFDEPFTGLDADASSGLVEVIHWLASRGSGIVLTSPRLDREYLDLAHKVYEIVDGELRIAG